MRKFITEDFEIDLSKLKITENSENPWFSDSYFAKFTFPFDIDLTEEADENLGFISIINSNSHKLLYQGKFVDGNELTDAKCEIIEVNETVSLQLESGFDEFPNFEKKLSDLPLEYLEVADIYQHAREIIPLTYPNVNYNFPQIYTDKIDTSDEVYWAFEGVINNYKNGEFPNNYYDLDEEETYNRNLIQPLPYALHILKSGFGDAGYVLKGDVLSIDSLKKMLIYGDREYWTTYNQESLSILAFFDQYDTRRETNRGVRLDFTRSVEITSAGRYRIVGEFTCSGKGDNYMSLSYFHIVTIKYRTQTLSQFVFGSTFQANATRNVDIVFDAVQDVDDNYVTVIIDCGPSQDCQVINLEINPIRLHDDSGEAIPTIINPNIVDLKRTVPDVTFNQFVTWVRNQYNLDMTLKGNEIWMNFIQKEMKIKEVIDLSSKDVKNPKRTYTWGNSFLLKYDQDDKDEYKYNEIWHDANGYVTEGFKTNDKTSEITLNALPLPLVNKNNILTAYAYEQDQSKIYTLLYSGLTDGLNLAEDNTSLTIPYLHEKYYKEWFEFRIKSQGLTWTFMAWEEEFPELNNKSRIYTHKHIALVKNISKTEVYPDLFEIEIQAETEL